MIKFMICALLLIPIVLFVTGIVQTFVLKSKQSQLANANAQNSEYSQQYEELTGEAEYKESDEYWKEYYKYFYGYGEDGDINVDMK